ncbi:hypothetical protein BJ993_002037 [Nocardioides aromaticivorans]|uniref:Uncharacterized protein n=1 Tax=Nocardioides aromaticivorans TaxID=200618 RepID=A0A7Z0CNL2_9ACTN|nr:hypothetical protein [Nocardioides aromaticivorans]
MPARGRGSCPLFLLVILLLFVIFMLIRFLSQKPRDGALGEQ